MLKKVVIAMNVEVNEVNDIRNKMNNYAVDDFVQFCMEDALFHDIVKKNMQSHGYPKQIVTAFETKDYKTVFEWFDSHDSLIEYFEKCFYDMNRIIYLKYEATTYKDIDLEGFAILPVAYSATRPYTPHTYIGWVTPFDTTHLIEHENVNDDKARLFQEAYSDLLRKHKDEFDVFFDGAAIEEVMEYIRSL